METVKRIQDKIRVFMTAIMSRKRREGKEEKCEVETVKRIQDKIGVFMTAIMSRKRRVGKEEKCEVETVKRIQDKIGVFMTAIMTRMEKGEREKEEPQREHRRKRVAPGLGAVQKKPKSPCFSRAAAV